MTKEIKIIVIGGSAGSFSVVRNILSSIPGSFPLPVILCLHRLRDVRCGFAESLNIDSKLPVVEPLDKTEIKPGVVYLSPANYHVDLDPASKITLSTETEINYSRPSIDLTLTAAGYAYREKFAGILLSGSNSDGAKGLFYAHRKGAFTIVQDPSNAQFPAMPKEALRHFNPTKQLTDTGIIEFMNSLMNNRYV